MPSVPTCQRGLPANVSVCQHGLRANVPACQSGLRASVPVCQRAKNIPTSHFYVQTCHKRANVSTGVPIFQTFLLQNVKRNFYTLLLYKKFYITLDIIVIHIMCICILHKNCIKLHFHTSCHITKKVWVFFCYFFSFLFLS